MATWQYWPATAIRFVDEPTLMLSPRMTLFESPTSAVVASPLVRPQSDAVYCTVSDAACVAPGGNCATRSVPNLIARREARVATAALVTNFQVMARSRIHEGPVCL